MKLFNIFKLTFREFLGLDDYNIYLRELRNIELSESLDSHSNIDRVETENNFKFYYFKIGDKEFRVILEKVDDETGINFEQKINNVYTTSGLTNNLSARDVMLLFGTVFYIINKFSITKHFSIFTDNQKKFRTYLRILSGKGAKNIRYKVIYNNKVAHIEFETDDIPWLDKKIKIFRYKTNI